MNDEEVVEQQPFQVTLILDDFGDVVVRVNGDANPFVLVAMFEYAKQQVVAQMAYGIAHAKKEAAERGPKLYKPNSSLTL